MRAVRLVFAASVLIPLALTAGVARAVGHAWPAYSSLLIAYALAGDVAIRWLARHGRGVQGFLSLAVLNVLVLAPELSLHESGYHFESGVQFGYPRPAQFESLLPDEELFWTLPPGRNGVNSLGFRGPEWPIPKPPEVFRVMVLGDSVPHDYPALIELFLNARDRTARRFEVANLSIEGYSTHQGRILAQRYGEKLEPDLVLVSYGWNDHWQAWGSPDSEKRIAVDTSARGRLMASVFHHVRMLQWVRSIVVGERAERPLSVPRVSPAEYRDNLTFIGNFFAARQVPVIFVTPSTTHDVLGVPDYVVERGFAATKEDVVRLHREYNAVVREVTASHGWPLLDLASAPPPPEVARGAFISDGIHLTAGGAALVAEDVVELMERLGLGEVKHAAGVGLARQVLQP